MASICCSPPESVPASCPALWPSTGNRPSARSMPSATAARETVWPPTSRFSRTVNSGKISRPSGTCPMPAATMASGAARVMSRPSSTMRPAPARTRPEIARSVLDLPLPLAPSSDTISPVRTTSDTPSRARRLP